jgi:hypothetical protein
MDSRDQEDVEYRGSLRPEDMPRKPGPQRSPGNAQVLGALSCLWHPECWLLPVTRDEQYSAVEREKISYMISPLHFMVFKSASHTH